MIDILGLAILRPYWLLALPLIAVIVYFAWRRTSASSGWERAVDPALMAAFSRMGRVVSGKARRNLMPAFAMVLIALALTGPATERRNGASFRNLDGVILVMDVSDSMTKSPAWVDAMTSARIIAQRAGSKPVGLVAYAGDAYLASALTSDTRVLGTTVSFLGEGIIPDPGSRPERGLAIADRILAEAEIVAGDVVLISDGDGLGGEASQLARAIRAKGARLSTIYVPTDRVEGETPPDRGSLGAIADLGGGIMAEARNPLPVAQLISSGLATRLESTEFAVLIWHDWGRFLLLLAMIPVLTMFRRVA